jgi:hypothetical protein
MFHDPEPQAVRSELEPPLELNLCIAEDGWVVGKKKEAGIRLVARCDK